LNTYGYVYSNPVKFSDETGLATYSCTRSMPAFPFHVEGGARNIGDFPGNFVFHSYPCVVDITGKVTCEGHGPSKNNTFPKSPFYGDDEPTEENNEITPHCEKVYPNDRCFENCMLQKMNEPRPSYGWPTIGKDCKEWNIDIRRTCKMECGRKTKRGTRSRSVDEY
jgi:hypothetical protein